MLESHIHSMAEFVIGLGDMLGKPAVCKILMAAWTCGPGSVHGDGGGGNNENEGLSRSCSANKSFSLKPGILV